jgi:regulator of protease activity HflC (stomatin/prohibitin superfamily)
MMRIKKIRELERGLLFKNREFQRILGPGRHVFLDPLWRTRVDVVSVRAPWLEHADLEVIARSGALEGEARVLDLKQHERALVWVNGRFAGVRGPGLAALWTVFHEVEVEVVDARALRFEHDKLAMILDEPTAQVYLQTELVEEGQTALVLENGRLRETLAPGLYAFWRGMGRVKVLHLDLREQVADVAGQEIMTADKVTLRVNALVTFRIVDAQRAVVEVEDPVQALYRQAQLALREVIGARELDALLTDREAVAAELTGELRKRTRDMGLKVDALGIRDVVLPGEMKDLLNQVTEAKKAAEAALITRREETAAMRSQANTARILESNPTLMRLRELEVLEKVAANTELNVVLGEGNLTDRVVKLI